MFFQHFSFQKKLFLIFSFVSFCLGMILFTVFYFYIKNNVRENSNISMQQISEGIATSLNYTLSNMNTTASQISSDATIQDIMIQANKDTSFDNYFNHALADSNYISSMLYTINSPLLVSARISIFDTHSNYVNYGSLPSSKPNPNYILNKYNLKEQFQTSENSFILLPPNLDHWNPAANSRISTFSLIREIYDLDTPTFPCIGFVELQQPYSLLSSICTKSLPDQYHVQILDNSGNVVYPYAQDSYHEPVISLSTLKVSGNGTPKFNENLVYCSADTISPWTIVVYQDKNVFLEPERLIFNYMILFAVLFFVSCCLIIYYITKTLTKPIKAMVKNLEDISLNDTSFKFDLQTSNDELILLNDVFESTLERLAEASKREIQAQANASYSHMLALQAQMNPHFLYNTLMVLNGLAVQKECDKISKMCSKLSLMLRYTAAYNEQNTTLKQEFDYAKAYLELMKMRYDDFLEYEFILDPELNGTKIPKLLIQPIIENAFKHGFSNKLPPYQIKLHVYRKNNYWITKICDNGCGFHSEIIEKFYQTLSEYEQNSENINHIVNNSQIGGLGLKNLYTRMKLYYNKSFIFEIENQATGGGCVTIGGMISEEDINCR